MERFIKHHPKSHLLVEAYLESGELHLLLKVYPKALERFEWLIKNNPQVTLAKRSYLGMEEAYRGLGKLDEAEKILNEYIEKYPQDETRFEAHLRIGFLCLTMKRFPDAMTSFSAALRSTEERVTSQAQFKLGEAYASAGNKEAAIQASRSALKKSPRLMTAYRDLPQIYLQERQYDEALKLLDTAAKQTDVDALY